MKKISRIIILLVVILIATTGCHKVSQKEKIECEKIGATRTHTWLTNNKRVSTKLIKSDADITGEHSIWPDVYLDEKLSGIVRVTVNYKGVNKTIKTTCDGTDEEAYEYMDQVNNSDDQLTACVTYSGIKVCNIQGIQPNIKVTTDDEKMDPFQLISTFKITQEEPRQLYRVYIPIYKIGGGYENLILLNTQVREKGDYTSRERLNVTNDFRYFYTNINITEKEGKFTILEN